MKQDIKNITDLNSQELLKYIYRRFQTLTFLRLCRDFCNEHKIENMEQLLQNALVHDKLMLPYIKEKFNVLNMESFLHVNILNKKVFKQQLIDFIYQHTNELLQELIPHSPEAIFYGKTVEYEPTDFLYVNDKINDTINSSISATQFSSSGRTSPLIVLDNNVLLGNDGEHHNDLLYKFEQEKFKEWLKDKTEYEQYHEQFDIARKYYNAKTVAVGSSFSGNKVAILEYVSGTIPDRIIDGERKPNTGNISAVVATLKAYGFKKVYLNINTTGQEYKRLAKIKRLMQKY